MCNGVSIIDLGRNSVNILEYLIFYKIFFNLIKMIVQYSKNFANYRKIYRLNLFKMADSNNLLMVYEG